MSTINIGGVFSIMPEGEHTLKITEAVYKEDFGKVKITMKNAKGQKHFENFTLTDKDGNPNDGACAAFAMLAKTALCEPDREEVDVSELVGRYLKGQITHRTYEDTEGKTKTATTKAPGTYWEEATSADIAIFENAEHGASEAPKQKYDLKSLLGR